MDIDVRVPTTADPKVLYALLRDGASWPEWSSLDSFELIREGTDEREGLGAVRLFRTGKNESYEELVALIPDRQLSYRTHGVDHLVPAGDRSAAVGRAVVVQDQLGDLRLAVRAAPELELHQLQERLDHRGDRQLLL